MQKDYKSLCKFFVQGKCFFGDRCKFSHDGFRQLYLLRHAQSIFNAMVDTYANQGFSSQIAKKQFQFNHQLVDCSLTQHGKKQASDTILPQDSYRFKKYNHKDQTEKLKCIDIVFVSPLNRTLQTTKIVLKNNRIKARKIIVMPELSQVLSKVCDFSCSSEKKKQNYPKYIFEELQELQKVLKEKNQKSFWQDNLLDIQNHVQISHNHPNGQRYMSILSSIFPQPLQSSQRCFNRAMLALQKINSISNKQNAKKILVVSHNRILKYMCGRETYGRAPSFQNCQIRKILIQK